MSRELDTRNVTADRADPARRAELEERAAATSATLPGSEQVVVADVDALTGNTSRLMTVAASEDGVAEDAPPSAFVERALDYLRSVQPALGLTAEPAQEFVADPQPLTTSTGAHAVHFTQEYLGIGIFQSAQTVRFNPDGTIIDTAGTVLNVTTELSIEPQITAQVAVLRAANHIAEPDDDEQGQVDQFGQPVNYRSVD